jgi:AcrR family transcriptional regulator
VRSDATRNRARILDVARDLVRRDGPAVSTDDIAREAGVAVGTLYRHFPTKAALVEAVVRHSIEQLADATEDAATRVARGASAGEELAGLFRLVASRHSADAAVKEAAAALGARAPGVDGAIDFEAGSPELRAVTSIVELLDTAAAEGSVRPDLTVADLLALVSGVPRDPVPAEVRDRYVEIVLAGVRAGASPASLRGLRPGPVG